MTYTFWRNNALGIGVSLFTVALIESIYNILLRDIATNNVALLHVWTVIYIPEDFKFSRFSSMTKVSPNFDYIGFFASRQHNKFKIVKNKNDQLNSFF